MEDGEQRRGRVTLRYTVLVALPVEQTVDGAADEAEALRAVAHDPEGLAGARVAVGAWLREVVPALRERIPGVAVGGPEAVLVRGDGVAAVRAVAALVEADRG